MAVKQKKRTGMLPVLLFTAFFIVLIAAGAFFFLHGAGSSGEVAAQFRVEGLDPAAQTGVLPGAPHSERAPGDGLFGYRINAAPTFSSDGSGGDIRVQNPAFNQYLMVLEIVADNAETVLYRSQYIAPNQYILDADLSKPLSSGSHDGMAYINVIDPSTLALVDVLECPLAINIQS